MGMAASQARFLGLTARKTNVEYQGQQVNQARTALANESSGLFNEMLGLKVPVPPVVNNYYESRYNFDGSTLDMQFSISSMNEIAGSDPPQYDVVIDYQKDILKGFAKSMTDKATIAWDGTKFTYDGKNVLLADPAGNEKSDIEAMKANTDLKLPANSLFYYYVDSSNKKNYFVWDAATDPAPPAGPWDSLQYYTNYKTTDFTANAKAQFTKDAKTGRFTMATFTDIQSDQDPGIADVIGDTPHELGISTNYNEKGYEEAMLEYDYQKMIYDNEIQRINSKTEAIQLQDRSLELKLRQLDTEQKALQTEMESVQKVIQKNVEVTFKTFA